MRGFRIIRIDPPGNLEVTCRAASYKCIDVVLPNGKVVEKTQIYSGGGSSGIRTHDSWLKRPVRYLAAL